MLPMLRVFTYLLLFVFLVGHNACMKSSVSQPSFIVLTVSTPDPQLSTPQPVPPEEVAVRLTSTSTLEPTATSTPNLAATEVALAAQMQTAIASTLTAHPTATPDLAATMTVQAMLIETVVAATLTALPTPTPLTTSSVTPMRPLLMATVNTAALNLRTGPGTAYPVVQSYERGTVMTILGKESGEQWLRVEAPDGEVGWMAMRYLQLSTDLVNIAVVETPPIPTPTLSP